MQSLLHELLLNLACFPNSFSVESCQQHSMLVCSTTGLYCMALLISTLDLEATFCVCISMTRFVKHSIKVVYGIVAIDRSPRYPTTVTVSLVD